ncbi:2,5-diketo-D-gluconic acid reductase [Paucilactobacillus hokkaidonensis JCM 18461]|uniref:2,5-diketo-D-gluconic acid reductase n=2 Tax=Paucilactobacillus hokkaidonensis TaxID=1193095 RepID=A0A0A1H1Y5_9LACO|nr:aldo/keto reductase [Paucilactobacillus hokkaidonensis]KRO10393.1 oxidoreductase [Paucilactobacillus hokkaidonensis]BAP86711.1 2,5-diketo-D-gluconic acid reductase [Paucilactobacillus hokkaidonensis JCM 18461]
MQSITDTYTLNNGIKIPIVGFGTWQTPDGDIAYKSVKTALSDGYRHIDTAAAYGNEESVGRGIKDSGVDRHDIFLTTKLWNENHGYEATKKAIETSLQKLGTDYVDLYLIHWPNPLTFRDNETEVRAGTWRAMEEIYKDGKARAIGISNFRPRHLESLMQTATIKPAVNQNYLNPSDLQPEIQAANAKYNILNEAYSPLGTGDLLQNPTLQAIAKKYDRSVAQITLRWSLEHGFLPLPKSIHADRIQQNTDLFDFELSIPDMKKIDSLHGSGRLATDPDTAKF